MKRQEDFVHYCAQMDFDKSGASQARVWQRVVAPAVKIPVWRKAVAWGVCALFFAAGMGFSAVFFARTVSAPYGSNFAAQGQTPGQEAVWVCVLDKAASHPAGCRCWKHRAADMPSAQEVLLPLKKEDFSGCRQTPPSEQQCTQSPFYSTPSFYDFCEEC